MKIRSRQLVLGAVSSAAFLVIANIAGAATCESLSGLNLPHATITGAQSISDGNLPSASSPVPLKGLPPFCRVTVTSKPTSDSLINIEVWIPLEGAWNGKYEQVGCGGFCGTLQYQYMSMARAIGRGYASAATDDGSQTGGNATFALGHPEKITDFGYRALKETTDSAKTIIAALAGKGPQRSYFNGCSDGGREALIEAQRFPEDFDGIIVGAPANAWTHQFAGFVANEQALLKDPESYIPIAKLQILSNAAIAQCRKHDTGAPDDPFLTDPIRCRFDPSRVKCNYGQDPNTCLTPAQVKSAKAIYGGFHDPHTGKLVAAGFTAGSEDAPGTWPTWIVGSSREANLSGNTVAPTAANMYAATRGALQGFYGDSFFRYFVFQNPDLDLLTLDVSAAVAAADQGVGKLINSTDPDLRAFKQHGGKIIHYHGWADAALAPMNSVNYYNEVRVALTGKPTSNPEGESFREIQDFYRLFMVPGMGHCGGGAGATEFGAYVDPPMVDADHDLMKALERWVEQGIAPDTIIATHSTDADPARAVQFQRPLCPFPKVARYDGRGNPADPASFTCRQ
jgi:hypothetical protein